MTKPSDDYTSRGLLVAATTLALLIAVSFIPPINAGGVKLRRASIVSDVVNHHEKEQTEQELQPEIDVKEFEVDLESVAEQVAKTTATASPTGEATSASWEGIFDEQPTGGDTPSRAAPKLDMDLEALLPDESLLTPVEVFGGEGNDMELLYEKILSEKPIRIAFMGDSFVEADILTADLRELLQDTFKGGGTGFAPMASPFTAYRQTVKTTAKGWTPYNIMQRKSTPSPLNGDYFVSGWVAQGSDGASTRWEMTSRRRHLTECRRARVLFISRDDSEIAIRVNDGEQRTFSFTGSEVVRQIVIEQENIASLEMTVLAGGNGITGYGADFEDVKGVTVDNFSIRSNNGQAMFWTNPAVNAQINSMRGYDLVILQYGLNIMQSERKDYSLYAQQVEKMIHFVKNCFPKAAVIVMGVSDRSERDEEGFKPMKVAENLSEWQRKAAMECNAAFWHTYRSMQQRGGMKGFVANGWAGKDYTHINYAGGREIATGLYHGLLYSLQQYMLTARQRMVPAEPVLDKELEILPPELNLTDELPAKLISTEQTQPTQTEE
ncbi:MAG: hypothetical protein E7131_00520 [Rikenellaceae bacterium]|nr:hypothetical protein [Rikenellaceae bacterium]